MNLMEANEVLEGPQVFSQLEPEVSIDKTDQEIMIMSLPSVPNDLDIETEERFQKQEMMMTSPNESYVSVKKCVHKTLRTMPYPG